MKTSSAKSKGRRLCQYVKDLLLNVYRELEPDDIQVTPSGVVGEDLLLSPAAQRLFPFSVECKNQEQIAIWQCLAQAESHALKTGRTALLVFSRNRSPTYAAMRLEHFLMVQSKASLFDKMTKGGMRHGESSEGDGSKACKEGCKESDQEGEVTG